MSVLGPSAAGDDRVKVLWLIKGLGPGGAEQLLLLAGKVLDRKRFEVRVAYVRADKTHLVSDFEAAGIAPERLGAPSGRLTRQFADLRRIMAEVDVVHAHSPVLASLARIAAQTLPAPQRPILLSTEHNEWTSHRSATRWLNAVTAPLDAHHWAVSEQVAATISPRRRRDYEVLIHGIDLRTSTVDPTVRARVRAALGIADDEILSLTVANLRRNKDYPNLLRAAKTALMAEPRLRFAAVGQGPLVEQMSELHAQLGLGDRFQFLGFRRDVADLMAAADVFTLASAYEGLPVAVMEAFAAGLPVVATAVGGLPQQVSNGVHGLLVAPGDADALAAALVKLASDDELRSRMAAAARDRAPEYDIRRAVALQEETYLRLLGARTN